MVEMRRKLIVEDGSEYIGYGFGAHREVVCELVFNTSMAGYQEIVSDPSYTDQAVVMTYPLIGNYGMTDDDYECKLPSIGGMVVRDYNDSPSNFRYTKTLSEALEENGIPGISGLDTRKLTKSIRDFGSRRAIITDENTTVEEGLKKINDTMGHEAGDKLIIKAADSIRKVTNNQVHAFRMGGDEFLMVACDVSESEANKLMERWEQELGRLNTLDDGIDCVVAVGMVYGTKPYDLSEISKKADELMYEDKKKKKKPGEEIR